MSLSGFRLRFSEPLESEFLRDHDARSADQVRWMFCFMWVLVIIASPGDYLLAPELSKPLLIHRLGIVVPGLIVISLLTNTRWYHGRVQWFALAFVSYGALIYVRSLSLLPDDVAGVYNNTAAVAIFFVYALLRLRFWWATAAGTFNVVLYLSVLFASRDVTPMLAYSQVSSLLVFNGLGMAMAYSLERYWRQSFLFQHNLRESERRSKALLNASPDALLIVNENKEIQHASASLASFFDQVTTKKDLEELWPRGFARIEDAIEEAILIDRVEPLEIQAQKGGAERVHELRFRRFDVDRVLIVVRDITGRKKDQLREATMELKRQQKQQLESLGVMAGGITHDFNSLLTVMLGQTELLLSKSSEEPEELHRIRDAIGKASELTEKMLAYAGKTRLKSRINDLGELINDMRPLLEASVHGRATIAFEIPAQRPNVLADRVQLEQVLVNFVTNAVEACKESGQIQVRVGVERLDQKALAQLRSNTELEAGDYVYLAVTDNGLGMSKEALPRIFEPFYSTKFQGRGMGLASVFGIITAHRGGIAIDTVENQGTTMKAYFPVTMAESSQELSAEFVKQASAWRGEGTILLVDDDETVTQVSKLMLENLGFEVMVAGGGLEAVHLYEQHHAKLRLIMLDMTMPDLGGDAVIERIQEKFPDARVLINTAYSQAQLMEILTYRDIVAGIIHKPYTMDELRVGLMNALSPTAGPDSQ
jgi:signal transduction histidine kinase